MKIFIVLIFIILLLGCTQKEQNNQQEIIDTGKEEFLPVSVWYSGGKARAPMLSAVTEKSGQEWKEDLRQIKKLGFNTVRTWVEWAHCEKQPGEYNFENLQLLAQLANQEGLKFIIQLYVDSAPDWVGKKYPEGMYEAQNGAKVISQTAPGFCTDHNGVRKSVLNFITRVARIAVQFPNFHGWDLWSEPHIVNWAYINYVPNVQFCYCDYTTARFRSWLKNKYSTLESLNKAWYRNFESWNDVEPPRFGTILSYTDFIDWKNFIYEKLAADLKMRYEAVRKADKTHVITSHAAVPSVFYSPYNGYGATDDFLMARSVDYYGTSLYPKHNHPSRHWEIWKFMIAVDFSRSANKSNGGFYVGEMQAGKGTIGLNIGDPILRRDHRIWMWSAIAKGAKAINIYAYYPMSSGYESGGYGLINLDGTITKRAVEAGKTAEIISDNMNLFLSHKPVEAEVAIVYNPLAQMVGGEQRHSTGDMHKVSMYGYYRVFAENNIPVDFIHRKDLENNNYDQYKLIIVPYPLMFSKKAAQGLKKFVENGGFTVSEARLAWNDERGFATRTIPGMGLDEIFGAVEQKVKMEENVNFTLTSNDHPALSNLMAGDILHGTYFAESFELRNNKQAKILAKYEDGTAGIVASKYGDGETLLIGSFMGVANHPESFKTNDLFLLGLLNWAGINRPFSSSHKNPVEIRLSETDEGYLLFIINHGQNKENVKVEITVSGNGQYLLNEMIENQRKRINANNKILSIIIPVDIRDVQVWRIKSIKK